MTYPVKNAERMIRLTELAKQTITAILITTLIFLLGSVLYYRSLGFLPFLLGLAVGTAVSIAKVVLLEKAVTKVISMEQHKANAYVSVQYLLRMMLTAAALLVGAVVPWISLWGALAGVIAFQIAIYIVHFKTKGKAKNGNPGGD